MAGLLDGLLGGGDPYALYGDLLTDQQRAALRDQQMGNGLLRMAAALAEAGKPSRLPTGGIGAAIGQAAGALAGNQDEALKGLMTAAQIRELQAKAKIREDMFGSAANARMEELFKRLYGGGAPSAGPSMAAPGGSTGVLREALPPQAPAPASNAPPPPPDVPPDLQIPNFGVPSQGPLNPLYGIPARPGSGGVQVNTLDVPLTGPQQQTGLLGAPDQVVGQQNPYLGLLAAAMGGGGGSGAPFQLASAVAPGGSSSPAGVDLPFPTIGGAAKPGSAWQQGVTYDAPAVPYDPVVDRVAGAGVGPEERALLARAKAPDTVIPPERGGLLNEIAQRESGNRNIMQQLVPTSQSTAQGPWQITNETWRDIAPKVGIDVEKYPDAMSVPVEVQRVVADRLLQERGTKPWLAMRRVADTSGGGTGGVPGMPAVPNVPGVDPQAMNMLLMELARRNAAAEAIGLGNPYGSMLSVLQGSPAYKGMIESATRGAGLPFVEPEAAAKARGAFPYDIATRQYQATLDRATKDIEMEGAARRDPAEILVDDGKGGKTVKQGTREQKIRAAYGFAVPELGIPGMPYPEKGSPGSAVAPATGAPAAGGTGTPGAPATGAGSLAGKPYLDPSEEATQKAVGPAFVKDLVENRRPRAESAVTNMAFSDTARKLLDAGAITGWGANFKLDVARAGAALGITDPARVANTETFLATQARQVANVLSSGAFGSGSSITDNDRKFAANMAGGSIDLNEDTLRRLLDLNERASKWELGKYNRDVERFDPRNAHPYLRVEAQEAPPVSFSAPSAVDAAALRKDAASAIAKGAPRDAVLKALRDKGIDPGGL